MLHQLPLTSVAKNAAPLHTRNSCHSSDHGAVVRGGLARPPAATGGDSATLNNAAEALPPGHQSDWQILGITPADLDRMSAKVPALAAAEGASSSDALQHLAAKAEALATEGLMPTDCGRLVAAYPQIINAHHTDAFLASLEVFSELCGQLADGPPARSPVHAEERLTLLGRLLCTHPTTMGRLLCSKGASHRSLWQWYEERLGVPPAALARAFLASPALFAVSAQSAEASAGHLASRLGVPLPALATMVLQYPPVLKLTPATLDRKLQQLESYLDLSPPEAASLAQRHPRVLASDLERRMPGLLAVLADLFGPAFEGRELLLANPMLICVPPATIQQTWRYLLQAGFSDAHIEHVSQLYPALFQKALHRPVMQQKLAWLLEEAGLSLDQILDDPRLLSYSLARMAGRHAFARARGLHVPVHLLARDTPDSWLRRMGIEAAEWRDWELHWLSSQEGRRWALPPKQLQRAKQAEGQQQPVAGLPTVA